MMQNSGLKRRLVGQRNGRGVATRDAPGGRSLCRRDGRGPASRSPPSPLSPGFCFRLRGAAAGQTGALLLVPQRSSAASASPGARSAAAVRPTQQCAAGRLEALTQLPSPGSSGLRLRSAARLFRSSDARCARRSRVRRSASEWAGGVAPFVAATSRVRRHVAASVTITQAPQRASWQAAAARPPRPLAQGCSKTTQSKPGRAVATPVRLQWTTLNSMSPAW
jgi:hypothetical protein